MGKTVYLHFSSRRPNNEAFGMFSVACYGDYNSKMLLTKEVVALELWSDSQHITAIQSYYNALDYIYRHQAEMLKVGVSNVMLVTNNSALVGWIIGDSRNKDYIQWVHRASKPFRFGQKKEITLGVGILKARDTEKSKQYCLLKNVSNLEETKKEIEVKGMKKNYKQPLQIDLDTADKTGSTGETQLKTIYDIIKDMEPEEMSGIEEV